jgi:hypothetical protein
MGRSSDHNQRATQHKYVVLDEVEIEMTIRTKNTISCHQQNNSIRSFEVRWRMDES